LAGGTRGEMRLCWLCWQSQEGGGTRRSARCARRGARTTRQREVPRGARSRRHHPRRDRPVDPRRDRRPAAPPPAALNAAVRLYVRLPTQEHGTFRQKPPVEMPACALSYANGLTFAPLAPSLPETDMLVLRCLATTPGE